MQQSPFTLKPSSDKKEIKSGYSEQFSGSKTDDHFTDWCPNWRFFPSELHIGGVKRRKRRLTASQLPSLPASKRARAGSGKEGEESSGRARDDDSSVKKVTFAIDNEKWVWLTFMTFFLYYYIYALSVSLTRHLQSETPTYIYTA